MPWSSCPPLSRSTYALRQRSWGPTPSIGTRLAVDDQGILTGHYQGLNCRGEEKVRRLRAWIDGREEVPTRLWAYGNGRGDLRMLTTADIGVNVGKLGALGRLRSFPGLSDTGPTSGSD